MNITVLSGDDTEILTQVLNQLANFLHYSPRANQLRSMEDTLQNLKKRLRELNSSSTDIHGIGLNEEELRAVVVVIPEIIHSLGDFEFELRTGRSVEEAQALRDRLSPV